MKYYSIDSQTFPKLSGIYFACRLDRKILYIGSTINFNDRLTPHPRLKEFIDSDAYFYFLLFFNIGKIYENFGVENKEKNLMRKYEHIYIRKYRPILNAQTKVKKSDKIIELNPFWLSRKI